MRKDGKRVHRYRVNFTSDLSATLAEVKFLEKLGFTVPDVARNMSIQVSDMKQHVLFGSEAKRPPPLLQSLSWSVVQLHFAPEMKNIKLLLLRQL